MAIQAYKKYTQLSQVRRALGGRSPNLWRRGEIKEQRSITNINELHKVVAEHNLKHLHQASETPMSHGEGFELFHGPNQHDTAEAVLEGKMDWKHPIEEVNTYISNMKVAYGPEMLAEEVKMINKYVNREDFWFYFKHKDESMKSSRSGRHMGHYKATLANDDFVNLHVAMINIGLKTGQVLER